MKMKNLHLLLFVFFIAITISILRSQNYLAFVFIIPITVIDQVSVKRK